MIVLNRLRNGRQYLGIHEKRREFARGRSKNDGESARCCFLYEGRVVRCVQAKGIRPLQVDNWVRVLNRSRETANGVSGADRAPRVRLFCRAVSVFVFESPFRIYVSCFFVWRFRSFPGCFFLILSVRYALSFVSFVFRAYLFVYFVLVLCAFVWSFGSVRCASIIL